MNQEIPSLQNLELRDLQTLAEREARRFRNLLTLFNSVLFEEAFKTCNAEQKSSLLSALFVKTPKELRDWARIQLIKSSEVMTLRELRDVGKRLGIINYSRMTKLELFAEINDHDTANLNAARRNEINDLQIGSEIDTVPTVTP